MLKPLPKSAVTAFIRKYGIKLRRVQRKKKLDKAAYLPKIMKWHSTLREGLIKSKSYSPTYNSMGPILTKQTAKC